ncbi:MAG: hypothetical protein N0E44_23215, partial [Candidatus Thiodiazotropha lotti]|nr:hypothetical protein [Candidatus Thiodiazotropha lotti]MCW4222780.1 hypothetical protein [Candidatus Thiodiazotropha lotti]
PNCKELHPESLSLYGGATFAENHAYIRVTNLNYNALIDSARDLLLLGVPEEQIADGIRRKEKRENVRSVLLEVLPILCRYFKDISPDFVHEVSHRFYSIDRDLKIPFKPTFIYGVGGQIYFPWFSFWRSNPLDNEQLSLFVTLVDEMLLQDPDLELAKFEILDFSAKNAKTHRVLRVIDTQDIPRLEIEKKLYMLSTFKEGFRRAEASLAKSTSSRKSEKEDSIIDIHQITLWD